MTLGILAAGVFEGFFVAVARLLALLYQFTGSYGGAIILLTILVMIVTAPLTLKSTRSMLQMQRHQPELKRLQAKYKDDREQLNQEMMAFYKENGINPLSGCVPVLIQAPVFLVLYNVLRGITSRDGGSASAIGNIAGKLTTNAGFKPWILHDQVFEPQHLKASSELYQSLHASSRMNFFGVDLSISPWDSTKLGVAVAAPFMVLMVLMVISQIIQNRQIQGRSQNAQVNPQQQMIMKVLPFMLPVFSFQFPAGLGLYYFVQGLCRIGLQGYITRAVYGPHHATSPTDVSSTEKSTEKKTITKDDKALSPKAAAVRAKAGNSTPPDESSSAKSATVQRKASGKTPPKAGRKSGDPRASGNTRKRSGSSDSKRG